MPSVTQKINYTGNLAEKILEDCSTVDQVVNFYRKYNEPNLGYTKFMFVDKTGASAIISWDWAKNDLSIINKENNYQLLGVGEWTLQQSFNKDTRRITVERFRALLEATRQEYKTVYSNIYDLKKGEIYIYNQSNFDYAVKLKLVDEIKKGKHFYKLSELFPKNQKNYVVNYHKNVYSTTQGILIIFFIVILLSPFIKWPITFLKNLRKHKSDELVQNNRISLVARLIAVANCSISLVLLYYLTEFWNLISKYGLSILGLVIGLLPVLIVILIIGETVVSTILWQKNYWTPGERVYYILLILIQIFEIFLLINLKNVIKL